PRRSAGARSEAADHAAVGSDRGRAQRVHRGRQERDRAAPGGRSGRLTRRAGDCGVTAEGLRRDCGGTAEGGTHVIVGVPAEVKEPVPSEYDRMRQGQVVFTYLHLAASRELTAALLDRKVSGVAYETVQAPDGRLPLLAPMSEVAGRMAPHVAARLLEKENGGR